MDKLIATSKAINDIDFEALNKLAAQLSHPSGKEGVNMGDLLDKTNRSMIQESVKLLQLEDKNRILELGHGSCKHLEDILKQAEDLKFFGMEVSEVMRDEAEKVNKTFIKKRKALFQLYDGLTIPYVSNFFHRILTVNTIYFIENPLLFFNEMYRIIRPGGKFVIAFANRKFMEQLPFVSNTTYFKLYDEKSIVKLLEKTFFNIDTIDVRKEKIKSKMGVLVEREYTIVIVSKKTKIEEEDIN